MKSFLCSGVIILTRRWWETTSAAYLLAAGHCKNSFNNDDQLKLLAIIKSINEKP
jgi:hypothetical protein